MGVDTSEPSRGLGPPSPRSLAEGRMNRLPVSRGPLYGNIHAENYIPPRAKGIKAPNQRPFGAMKGKAAEGRVRNFG